MSEKRFISWDGFNGAMFQLAQQLTSEPDHVVGVARGGLPGAVFLSHALEVPLNTIWATHYDGEERQETVEVENYGLAQVEDGDRVLLFDDIVDTGKTMDAIATKWRNQDMTDFTWGTMAIHVKPDRQFDPDFWVEETDEWVTYPWECSL